MSLWIDANGRVSSNSEVTLGTDATGLSGRLASIPRSHSGRDSNCSLMALLISLDAAAPPRSSVVAAATPVAATASARDSRLCCVLFTVSRFWPRSSTVGATAASVGPASTRHSRRCGDMPRVVGCCSRSRVWAEAVQGRLEQELERGAVGTRCSKTKAAGTNAKGGTGGGGGMDAGGTGLHGELIVDETSTSSCSSH